MPWNFDFKHVLVLSLETGCKWSSKSNYTSVLCRMVKKAPKTKSSLKSVDILMIKKAPKTKSSLKSVDILTCIFSDKGIPQTCFHWNFSHCFRKTVLQSICGQLLLEQCQMTSVSLSITITAWKMSVFGVFLPYSL